METNLSRRGFRPVPPRPVPLAAMGLAGLRADLRPRAARRPPTPVKLSATSWRDKPEMPTEFGNR
ncbi:MAG: hypothetical protein ACLUW6_03510 [Coriobacteriaceae bacterium]